MAESSLCSTTETLPQAPPKTKQQQKHTKMSKAQANEQINKNKQKNPTPTYKRSTTGRKNSHLRWKYMNSTNILKQETGKCVEQTYRKSILHLLEIESEVPFLIFCYSEKCTVIEMLQVERQQLISGSRGDVYNPLKQWEVVTKPNTKRHFYTV